MKRARVAIVLAVTVFGTAPAAFAQVMVNSVSDAVCPTAIQQIKKLSALDPAGDPVKISDAARGVVETYKECAVRAQADGLAGYMRYDQVRAAQYGILFGRALFAQKDYDGAHAAFVDARRLSAEVADWTSPSMGYTMNNATGTTLTRNLPGTTSSFHELAVDIRKAADVELSKLVPAKPAQ